MAFGLPHHAELTGVFVGVPTWHGILSLPPSLPPSLPLSLSLSLPPSLSLSLSRSLFYIYRSIDPSIWSNLIYLRPVSTLNKDRQTCSTASLQGCQLTSRCQRHILSGKCCGGETEPVSTLRWTHMTGIVFKLLPWNSQRKWTQHSASAIMMHCLVSTNFRGRANSQSNSKKKQGLWPI